MSADFWNYTLDRPKELPCTSDDGDKFENISDPDGRGIYLKALQDHSKNPEGFWNVTKGSADQGRKGSNLHEAAYLYLAMAKILTDHPDQENQAKLKAPVVYHRAGHAFREFGELNRAGDAYWRAGYTDTGPGSQARQSRARSFSRAKACYGEVGDIEKADKMHRCEWQARRQAMNSPTLGLWFMTSGYGTSVKRWLLSLAIFLAVFTVVYQVLETSGVIKASTADWIPVLSAFYYSVTTSVTLDQILITGWVSTLLVLLNLILANILLAVGATVLGQKILRR